MLARKLYDGLPLPALVRRLRLHDWSLVVIVPFKRTRCDIPVALDDLAHVVYTVDCRLLSARLHKEEFGSDTYRYGPYAPVLLPVDSNLGMQILEHSSTDTNQSLFLIPR